MHKVRYTAYPDQHPILTILRELLTIKIITMQSQRRKLNRINKGLQNIAPRSTKIARVSTGESIHFAGYRKGRFNKQ